MDLQLLWPADEAGVDLVAVTTERLFAFRRAHAFPCTCTPDWPTAYPEAAIGLDLIANVEPAVGWPNTQLADLRRRINMSWIESAPAHIPAIRFGSSNAAPIAAGI